MYWPAYDSPAMYVYVRRWVSSLHSPNPAEESHIVGRKLREDRVELGHELDDVRCHLSGSGGAFSWVSGARASGLMRTTSSSCT
mgnify:CR=1 FL=1